MENGNGKYGVIIIFELLIIIGLYLGIKIVNPEIVVKDQIVADAREIFNPEGNTEEEEMEVAEAGISDKLVFFGDTSEMYAEDVNPEAAGDGAASDGSTPEGYANGVGADGTASTDSLFSYPDIDFAPHAVESTQPTNYLISTEVAVGDTILADKAEYPAQSIGDITFETGSKYTDQEGVFTFRGNNFRDNPTYGMSNFSTGQLSPMWSAQTGALTFKDATWSGSGWTGQPLMRHWSRETKAHMNMFDWAKEDDSLVEVIYACMDGKIYFLDLRSGQPTRDPMDLGYTFKGSGALDPRGYPLMYVGAGYDRDDATAKSFIINLLDCSIIYTFGDCDPFSLRGSLSYFDSSPLVDPETDTLIYPGENGILYLIHLGTNYDESAGTLSLALDKVVRWRYSSVRTTREKYWPGMETSAAIYKNYLFIADNGANLICLDLNSMQTIWVQDILDDSNSTPVLSIENDHLYIYVSTSFHLGWRSNSSATVPIWKIDAETGEIVWQTEYVCSSLEGVSGGVQSTIAVGRGNLNDMIYVTVAMSHGTGAGDTVALRKSDGAKVWELTTAYTWSSPVCVYNQAGEGEVIFGASDGNLRCLNGQTGEAKSLISISSGNIEASPAVYEDYLVVGTRAGNIWGVHLD